MPESRHSKYRAPLLNTWQVCLTTGACRFWQTSNISWLHDSERSSHLFWRIEIKGLCVHLSSRSVTWNLSWFSLGWSYWCPKAEVWDDAPVLLAADVFTHWQVRCLVWVLPMKQKIQLFYSRHTSTTCYSVVSIWCSFGRVAIGLSDYQEWLRLHCGFYRQIN